MNLSWEPASESSTAIAVARDVKNPSHYKVVYLNSDEDGAQTADAYVEGPAGGFGAAKISLPPSKQWQLEALPPMAPESDDSKREVLLVTGPSGSGKSHWVRAYVKNYLRLFPKNDVYLISNLKKDDTLDAVKEIKRIDVDKLAANPPKDIQTWANSLVIIDDVEGLDGPKATAVQQVQDMIASEGRHSKTTLLRAAHNATDYKKTRLLLQECHAFVIFPQHGGHNQLTYLLTKYASFDKKAVASVLKSPTRWLMIHYTAPRYIMTQHELYLMP
jgi:hypothetical protein